MRARPPAHIFFNPALCGWEFIYTKSCARGEGIIATQSKGAVGGGCSELHKELREVEEWIFSTQRVGRERGWRFFLPKEIAVEKRRR